MSRFVSACLSAGLAVASAGAVDLDARRTAERVGGCLARGCGTGWRDLLPARGKVEISLRELGGPHGSFAPDQARAVLDDVAARGTATSFDIVRIDVGDTAFALVRLSSSPRSGDARDAVGVHLVLQREDDRWTVREIRDSAP